MNKLLILLLISFASYAQVKNKPVDFSHGKLQVSDNRRFLQHVDGTPFFYLGDTAWELFHRLDRPEADAYLRDRAKKGFTVIQAVALAEFNGIDIPNAYGHLPLRNHNPEQPDIRHGDSNDYWDHVDHIIDQANRYGLYIGLLPTWGQNWHDGDKPLFTPQNAYIYGLFLGQRYKDRQIIWILGGDRNIEHDRHREIIRSMARGLREGDRGAHLITFHPSGGRGSAEWLHDEPWLDFNMRQNGHNLEYTNNYAKTLDDYSRNPPKPVLDGEPVYEDHPVSFKANQLGHSLAADVRRAFYWDTFNGAFGHTYGHHSVWQMYEPEKRHPVNNPLMPWKQALQQPGATQMMYGKHLLQSRPFLTRIPDPSIIVPATVPTAVPGEGRYRYVATRDREGTYAMIYAPAGRSFDVRTEVIKAKKITAWWYNPRNGKAQYIGQFQNTSTPQRFDPPEKGETTDWILVLDDASRKYPRPGKPMKTQKTER
jgi:hypothetical protein